MRSFFRYLVKEKKIKNNPAQNVRAPKAKIRLPENLDTDMMMRLLDIKESGFIPDRDRAILEKAADFFELQGLYIDARKTRELLNEIVQ